MRWNQGGETFTFTLLLNEIAPHDILKCESDNPGKQPKYFITEDI